MTETQIALSMAYKNLFSSEHGKKVLEDLDRECLLKGNIFDAGSSRITDFNLGKNAVIRHIHKEIERKITEKKDNKAQHKEII